MKVYIAAPFFNEDQLVIVKAVEAVLKANNIDFFSPRSEGVLKDMTTEEQAATRKHVFDTNIEQMDACTHMVACVEFKDTGTLFEIGYFYGKKKPTVLYSSKHGTVNVMLAQSAFAVCDKIMKLADSLRGEYTVEITDLT